MLHKDSKINETAFVPFENIGLCFSGGGYRATFFALGVVSYLNKIKFEGKPLLENVEAISTVSGGSLLGVAYAKACQNPDFKFDNFYKEFYSLFTPESDRLLENAISKLQDESIWKSNSHKKRTLINAFALAYEDLSVFKGDFDIFNDLKSSKLKQVCFNATEFSYGLAFRFQNTGKFGNKPLDCKELKAIKDKIRLSDVVASSSCFPMGFEPLVFPDDYFKDKKSENYKALKVLNKFSKGVGIMDGGIVDNQGIGSMINMNKSRNRVKPLDLIILNDVGSYKMEPWQEDTSKIKNSKSLKDMVLGILNYLGIHWPYWVTLLVGVLLLLVNSLELILGKSHVSLYVFGGIITGIGLSLTLFGSFTWLIKKLVIDKFRATFKKIVPEALIDEVTSFQKLDIRLIKRMLTERMTSTAKMVSEIFLKQIRRLNYNLIYSKEEDDNKLITCTVYELNGKKTLYKNKFAPNQNIHPAPKEQLKSVALVASEAPTSLWWDDEDISTNRMDSLIACGQFTTCYNLMDYILKLKKNSITSQPIDDMYELLKADWKHFNEKPLGMV